VANPDDQRDRFSLAVSSLLPDLIAQPRLQSIDLFAPLGERFLLLLSCRFHRFLVVRILHFEFQLPGRELLQRGVGFQTPDRRATEHSLILNADLPGPDMERVVLSGGLSPAIRWPEFVAQAGRAVYPRFEHDLLPRLQVYFNRDVAQAFD